MKTFLHNTQYRVYSIVYNNVYNSFDFDFPFLFVFRFIIFVALRRLLVFVNFAAKTVLIIVLRPANRFNSNEGKKRTEQKSVNIPEP